MSCGESVVEKTREQLRALYLPKVWRSVRAEPSQSCYWGLVRSSKPPTSFPPKKKKKKESEPAIFLNDVWTFLFKVLHLLFSTKLHLKPQQSWQCLLSEEPRVRPHQPSRAQGRPRRSLRTTDLYNNISFKTFPKFSASKNCQMSKQSLCPLFRQPNFFLTFSSALWNNTDSLGSLWVKNTLVRSDVYDFWARSCSWVWRCGCRVITGLFKSNSRMEAEQIALDVEFTSAVCLNNGLSMLAYVSVIWYDWCMRA